MPLTADCVVPKEWLGGLIVFELGVLLLKMRHCIGHLACITTCILSPCVSGHFHWADFARANRGWSNVVTGIRPGFKYWVTRLLICMPCLIIASVSLPFSQNKHFSTAEVWRFGSIWVDILGLCIPFSAVFSYICELLIAVSHVARSVPRCAMRSEILNSFIIPKY